MATKEAVLAALREVLDPELGLSVVDLGMIREVNLESAPAEVKMVLTTPFCPFGPSMAQEVKEAAERVTGKEVKVQILAEPWDPDMMDNPDRLGFRF
jgi:metal-sulfur cluster biosynthetic enzyme